MTHVFFDLDGTLTDPRQGIVRCIQHALATLSRPCPESTALEQFIGPPLANTFRTLLNSADDALVTAAVSAYRSRFESLGMFENEVYPGIAQALGSLSAAGYDLYVVTAKPRVYARRILEHFGLASHFSEAYGPELGDFGYDKASLLRGAIQARSLDIAKVFVVGDRSEDILAARSNGVISIAVTWGYGSREELAAASPHHVVSSVTELLACLSEQPGKGCRIYR